MKPAKPKYELFYKRSVEKDLRRLPDQVRASIMQKIQGLAENPRPISSVKLRGSRNLYRVRQSDYRIIYQIDNGRLIILIIKVGHRKGIYRES